MKKIVSFLATITMITASNAEVDRSSPLTLKERMALFSGKKSDSNSSQSTSEKNNASSSMESMSSEAYGKSSVQDLKKLWEKKAVDAKKPMEKKPVDAQNPVENALSEVGNQLGSITKECEDSSRREAYIAIKERCEVARASDEPKDFDQFYTEYQKVAPKLKDLRNLGEYSPDASEQKRITNVEDIRSDKFERYGTLDRDAPCKKFAEHMSVVHPTNNAVFEKVMKCIAEARSNSVVGEDEVQ